MNKNDAPSSEAPVTYESYLRIPELISLQRMRSEPPHHDEMLFIIIHQAYELWFRLLRHEIEKSISFMQKGEVLRAQYFVHRMTEIFRLLVHQIHMLETLAPTEYLQFRDRLNPASGFQSVQFREVEFMLGAKEPQFLKFFENQPDALPRLQARLEGPDLRQAYVSLLITQGFDLPPDAPLRQEEPEVMQAVLSAVKKVYEYSDEYLPLYLLSEELISLDQQLSHWREHHVRVVERVIGFKKGTGGSTGVGYLKTTTDKRCFPFLWDVRTILEKRG